MCVCVINKFTETKKLVQFDEIITCKISHKDQAVLAESIMREPLIHSPLLELCGWIWWSRFSGNQFMNFNGGPLIKAYTKAPERLLTEPNTLAKPCTFFIEMLSILKKQK